MTNETTPPQTVGSNLLLGPLVEPVTLADVLDALNLFNRPKPGEDEVPWEAGHFIRVDYLPAFINIIAAAWFPTEPLRARIAELEATEEGAKTAFGHVVEQKQASERECMRLQGLLAAAYADIRRAAQRA